ncbi:autoinducer-2 kinase [Globicatella sulfidifaciens]|uniref:autoinducer-2 kinase n=1 Tax=Globicatella sulfidifaciens TaxID=136093 RepID=UPI00288ECB1F|nr:autoinducer-2 kinase [Globicatella sulfidifaciens]MDT2767624.1 autoinducer-2 kinase [Globicatella sulfidifaciens]
MEKYLMALDGGTSSFRAILFDLNGNQKYIEQVEWEHLNDPNIPGSMDFDYQNNWQLIRQCIRNVIEKNDINSKNILALATTTMREGFVLYDHNGQELIAFANVDSRAVEESTYLKKNYPHLEKELYEVTGESFALGALPRLLWVKHNRPDLMERSTQLSMLNDWISFKLSGKIAVEPSNASTTGLYNIIENKWEYERLSEFGIQLEPTPILESGSILGNVSKTVSEETGLSTSTLVVMGGGDAQLGSLGVGSIHNHQATLLGGSFWQLEFNTTDFVNDTKGEARINRHAIPGFYQYELISWMPGVVSSWILDAFFDIDKEYAGNKKMAFKDIEEKASKVPIGSNGIITCSSNTMNMLNLNNCAPTFTNFNFDKEKCNRFTLFRSYMESVAYTVLGHKEKIEELSGQKISNMIFAGGASNNKLWCQILADVLNCEILVPVNKEATAFGAALLASIGAGLFDSIEDAANLIEYEKTYYPNELNHQEYQIYRNKWREVYLRQLELSNQNITASMWKAPGL